MIEFLLFVMVGLLIYLVTDKKRESKPKDRKSYKEILPEFLDKECEINVNKPLFSMDVLYTMRGRMVDLDDEWLMLEQVNKKKKVVRVFRTEFVSGIKEIKD